jgi:hypothetical protein
MNTYEDKKLRLDGLSMQLTNLTYELQRKQKALQQETEPVNAHFQN